MPEIPLKPRYAQPATAGRCRPVTHLVAGAASGFGVGAALSLAELLLLAPPRGLGKPSADLVVIALVTCGWILAILGSVVGLIACGVLEIARRRPQTRSVIAGYAAFAVGCLPPALHAASRRTALVRHVPQESPADLALPVLASLTTAVATYLLVSRLPQRRLVGPVGWPWKPTLTAALWVVAGILVVGLGWVPVPAARGRPQTSAQPEGASRPNIILVTIDTLSAERVGAYGHERIRTPNLDAIALAGVRFDRAIVQQPNTNASHASIFTGTYPHTHGIRSHMVDSLSPTQPTMASLLGASGYVTAGFYSWVSLDAAFSGLDKGFDEYHSLVVNRPVLLEDSRLSYLAAAFRRLATYLAVFGSAEDLLHMGEEVEERLEGRADLTTKAALEWLGREPGEPFFLWVHYFDPHYPYAPPPPYDRLYDPGYDGPFDGGWETIHWIREGKPLAERDVEHIRALYDGEVSFVDEQLGRLLADLDRRGLSDRSVLVVTADHGESLGEKGWFHPGTLFDAEIRVPLLIRCPGLPSVRKVIDAPVQSIDILPTVLELAGVPAPGDIEGRSLVPLMRGQEDGDGRLAFSELPGGQEVAVVSREWKLIVDQSSGEQALYHLAGDPREEANLADERPEVVAWLRASLDAWLQAGRLEASLSRHSPSKVARNHPRRTTE